MDAFFTYLFWPNPPGETGYGSPKALALLILCGLLVAASFCIAAWRKRQTNPMTKKLSRSWSSAAMWFGCIGLFLVVCRVEHIQYLAMRFLWVVWLFSLLLYVGIQVKLYRTRHYEVISEEQADDPRDKYLPKKKRR